MARERFAGIHRSLSNRGLRRVVTGGWLPTILAVFGIEFAVAIVIGVVSLFADSVDFLEDTSVNPAHLAPRS